jgi:hypothetical protein
MSSDLDRFLLHVRTIDLGEPGRPRRPPRRNVRRLKRLVAESLADGDFVADCILRDIGSWARWERSGWVGAKAPIGTLAALGISVELFSWESGAVAEPHEHTSWTVSGILHNWLQVDMFDWDLTVARRRLVPARTLSVRQTGVACVYDKCIHSPRNTSASTTTSLHVYHSDDHPSLEREVGPICGLVSRQPRMIDPSTQLPTAAPMRARDQAFDAHVEALRRLPGRTSLPVLEHLYRVGNATTRRRVTRALKELLTPREVSARIRSLSESR